MSQISGIRNLRDLYSSKYQDKEITAAYSGNLKNQNRIKLPQFAQTKNKFVLNQTGVNSRKSSKSQKNQGGPNIGSPNANHSNLHIQQNSMIVNSSREPKVVQLNLNSNNQSQFVSKNGSPQQSPRTQQIQNNNYGVRSSRRNYNSIFNHGYIKQNSSLHRDKSKRNEGSLKERNSINKFNQSKDNSQINQSNISRNSSNSRYQQFQQQIQQQQSSQKQVEQNYQSQQQQQPYQLSVQQQKQLQQQQQQYFQQLQLQELELQKLVDRQKGGQQYSGNQMFNEQNNNNSHNNSQRIQNSSHSSHSNNNNINLNKSHINKSSQHQHQLSLKSNNNSSRNLNSSRNGSRDHSSNRQKENNRTLSIAQQFYMSGLSKTMFNFHYVVGKGGFGKVWKVDFKKTKQVFAMKEMSKAKIITKRSVNSVMSEKHLLSQLRHPFLVNMNFAFQDRESLYLIMDLLTGGDLRFHIGKYRRFKEVQTRFFIACIVLALEYLHNHNIIHRDIKPENLVLDELGYVRVTDLGIARIWKPENSQDTSGTPGYMAPEVMCRQNHSIGVDYFAVGVIGYEFMMGRRPYLGRSRKEIRDLILAKQVQVKKHEIPEGWSLEAVDFINRMIQRKPAQRLGANGPQEVKNHPWLKNFPWQKLLNKELQSPFVPHNIEDNFDYRNQISDDNRDTQEELIQQNGLLLRRKSIQDLFSGYDFDGYKKGQGYGNTGSTFSTSHKTNDTSNNDKQYSVNSNTNLATNYLLNSGQSNMKNSNEHQQQQQQMFQQQQQQQQLQFKQQQKLQQQQQQMLQQQQQQQQQNSKKHQQFQNFFEQNQQMRSNRSQYSSNQQPSYNQLQDNNNNLDHSNNQIQQQQQFSATAQNFSQNKQY